MKKDLGERLTAARRRRSPRRQSAWGAILMLALSRPAAANQLAGATMVVFAADGTRQVALSAAEVPTLTVFTAEGRREVAMAESWPEIQGRGYLQLSSGYRHDQLRYTVPGNGINILSELTWDVPAAEIRLDGGWTHSSGLTVKGHLAYAQAISGGRVQDSDYLLNDRQGEFSRSYSEPENSRMLDLSLGAGWRLPLGHRASLTPLFGLAHYDSLYRMRNGQQVVADYGWSMPLGPLQGLDSTYNAVWSSLWQGWAAEFKLTRQFALHADVKHHWFDYRAAANWNLRSDRAHPVSFRHQGHGRGWEAALGADWDIIAGHRLTLDFSGRQLKLKDGKRTIYAADGSSVDMPLSEIVADSWSARLGYRHDY